jgi:hypothetical protein
MRMLKTGCMLFIVALTSTLACSDDDDSSGTGGTSGSGGSGGSGGSTGGSGGSTGGSGGSTGGSAGSTGGSAGSTGGSAGADGGCNPGAGQGPGGCYTCGQVIDFAGCPAPPPTMCGWAVPGNDAGLVPTASAEKFFAFYAAMCEPAGQDGSPGGCFAECQETCETNEVPNATCVACWPQKIPTEFNACNTDDGT